VIPKSSFCIVLWGLVKQISLAQEESKIASTGGAAM